MPGIKRLVQIARTLETTPDYLLGLSDDPNPTPDQQMAMFTLDYMTDSAIEDITHQRKIGIHAEHPISNSSPLLTETMINSEGDPIAVQLFSLRAKFLGFFALPSWMDAEDHHAILCGDNSLWPKFGKGDLIIYTLSKKVEVGDYAIFRLKNCSYPENRPGLAFFTREIVAEDADGYVVRQHKPSATFRVPKSNIDEVNRVVSLEDIVSPHGINAVNLD